MTRMLHAVCLAAVLAALGVVWAAGPAPTGKELATVEAVLAYCVKFAPAAAGGYREQLGLLTKGTSDETLVKLRNGPEYRQAQREVDEFLAKVDARNAEKVCTRHVARK